MRRIIFIFGLVLSMIALQGCGGGGGTTPTEGNNTGGDDDGGGGDDGYTPGTDTSITDISQLKNIRISIAGSSITNGDNSYIGQNSYVGKVEEYLRETKATTLMSGNGLNSANETFTNEPLCYKGTLSKYSGTGTTIRGTLTGDEISLAYAKERGNKGAAIIEFSVDGEVIETFSTYDATVSVKTGTKSFTGDGAETYFDLGEAFTFEHTIRVNGAITAGHINDELNDGDGINPKFNGDEWMIIKKISNGKVNHFILFENPPSFNATIYATFKYGESIKPGKSTIGNLTQFIGSGTESPFGDGGVAFDITKSENIASGLDFRQTDDRAIKTWNFDESKQRNFTFTIKSLDSKATGSTPEFFVNFVTNRMHYIQNAGIGGFKASSFLETSGLTNTKQIIAFRPNIFILESGTNDANYRANRPTTNEWIVPETNSCTINPNSARFTTTNNTPKKGDILVVGSYTNDIDDVAIRIIESWDAQTKTATFLDDIVVSNYNVRCKIKRIEQWEDNVEAVISKVRTGVGLPLFVGIGTSGVPNLTDRKLAGYMEKGKLLADKLDAKFINFYQKTYDFNGGIDETGQPANIRWSYGDNTHPNATGKTIFGDTINETLFGN